MRKGRVFAALVSAGLSMAGIAHAEMVIINGKAYEKGTKEVPAGKDAASGPAGPGASPNSANVQVSDPLRIKKVFLFPSLDDLSGVLSPKLDETLTELFAKNPRFDLVRDPAVMRALSPDEAAYAKAATNQAVHREAARVTGADTTVLLRTRNAGGETEMTLEFRDANGDLLFSESGNVPGYSAMSARTNLAGKLFQNVLAKIPFEGTVTGRAGNTLTLDLGSDSVKTGDEVDLARIVSVQRHPLLRTVVGTDYVRTGKARITNTDKAISFAEVSQEFPGESVRTGAKVLISRNTVVRRPEREVPELENEPAPSLGRGAQPVPPRRDQRLERGGRQREKNPLDDRLEGEFDRKKARFGQAGLNLAYGSLTHSQTEAGNLTELSGGGLGGSLDAEIWITREWIATVAYGFHGANLAGSGISAGSTSWSKFELAGGYRIFPDEIAEGVEVTGSLGYQSQKYKIPTAANTRLSAKGYSGIVLKLDGSVQYLPDQKVTAGFAFQPFSSFSDEDSLLGSPDGASVVSFHLAWNYRFADSFWARVGLQFDTANGNYENGSSASDKRFAIGPGIYYSF